MAQDSKARRCPHPRYPRNAARRCGTAGGESVPDRLYPRRPPCAAPPPVDAFRQTLRELGWVEGQNITLEFRAPAREGDAFDEPAADLIRLQVDVIVATGIRAVRAAMHATRTTPIVMSPVPDPVGQGVVASLARPGGNVTGTSLMEVDLHGKRLELLKEMIPDASRVAVLWTPGTTAPSTR